MTNIPLIVKNALEQNNIDLNDCDLDLQFPIRLGEIADQIELNNSRKIEISGIEIDCIKKTASNDGGTINLTEKEVELISFLNSSSTGVDKEQILEKVWGYAAETNTRTVDTHLHRLNGKIQDAFSKKIIHLEGSVYILNHG